jgi:hypothetical protein
MKPAKTFLAVAILALTQFAQAQKANFSTPANALQGGIWIERPQSKLITPFDKNVPPQNGRIIRYKGLDARPWMQIVGWHPNESISQKENAEIHESQLHLLTIRF